MKTWDVSNNNIVVLGLARSGVAVARLLHFAGANVIVNDKKPREESPEAETLEALGIKVICGSHPEDLIHAGVDMIVKNPGIPYHIGPIQTALQLDIPIVTEVEVAYQITSSPIIAITGSNGKTTTTTWIAAMLDKAGKRPIAAGNIGRALSEAAQEADGSQPLVVELSSFQLKGTQDFRPNIACLLNISEAHMDYHVTMKDYIYSKAKIFANQKAEDVAVINMDCSISRSLLPGIRARLFPFSMTQSLAEGVYVDNGNMVVRDQGGVHFVADTGGLLVRGRHNVENALAATAVSYSAGVSLDTIRASLYEFRGVEHRLEWVRTIEEIAFYNDSKATNPKAAIGALNSFEEPVVWIAGGLDRGIDFSEIEPFLAEKVKAVVAFGQSAEKIIKVAKRAGISDAVIVDTVNAAVQTAYALARRGDAILLSPACASWDMFSSFEERGRIFKESVHNLLKKR